jgi:hypothetical protein
MRKRRKQLRWTVRQIDPLCFQATRTRRTIIAFARAMDILIGEGQYLAGIRRPAESESVDLGCIEALLQIFCSQMTWSEVNGSERGTRYEERENLNENN